MVTLSDVAKQAGVSPSTVSRVVNHSGFVSKDVADRVRSALVELDYRPNIVARNFRSKTTMTIGVVVSDLTNLYFMDALRGVEEVLSSEGYLLLIASSNNEVAKELQYCAEFDRRRVDGIILASAGASGNDLAQVFRERSTIMLLDRIVDGAQFDCVLDNNNEGVRQVVQYLLSQGHKDLGVVSGPLQITAGGERVSAFEKFANQAGLQIPLEWSWVGDAFSMEFGYKAATKFMRLAYKPSAVFCTNNALTAGFLLALAERDVRVPEDISVVSYGSLENGELLATNITEIEQPARQIGRVAAHRLLRRIRGEDVPFEVVRVDPQLSLGNSVKFLKSVRDVQPN
ncbi:MAG: LacI family transcriptional regulator [Firmicutes bacterium]|nr:LacI family transcriptional regulator [Bacillota bacterium]